MIEMIDTGDKKVIVPVEIKTREDIDKIVGKAELLAALVKTVKNLSEEIARDMADFKVGHPQIVPEDEKTDWEQDYFGPIGWVNERTNEIFRRKVEEYEKR